MTTIAWDGRVLAADGMVMTGGDEPMILQRDYLKIRSQITEADRTLGFRSFAKPTHRMRAVAVAGSEAAGRQFEEWWFSGAEGEFPLDLDRIKDQFHAITLRAELTAGVTQELVAEEWDDCGYSYALPGKFALGCGLRYATAAMCAGADALRAIGVAVELDPGTDGQICYLDTDNWDKGVQKL